MSTNVTLHAGHDVAYFTSGQDRGGCAGAMSYYTAAGEPPGRWAGKGAASLGLSGQVDPAVIGRLYQDNIGPGGELLVKRRQSKAAAEREKAAVSAYQAEHPYASATELAEVRAAERGRDPHHVPYFDLTVSAVKSVSVLHASYRVAASQARDAAGSQLTNRDTLQVTAFRGPDAEVRRQQLDGTWTGTFLVSRSYLADHAELAYAGNVHVAQGRTVDTAHLLVTGSLSRQALYVGMTRGRESNTAHVVTGQTAAPGKKPYQQATPESVLADILQRDADDLSATGQIRRAQERAGGTGHLLTLWSAAVRQTLYPKIDQQIKARLTDSEAWRYEREPSRPVLHHTLRDAQLAEHDISAIIDRITAAPMDGARSIASVLHGRLQRLQLPAQGHGVTWAQRTPQNAPALAHELAAGLEVRHRELGARALANPEPWLTRHLGPPPGPDASSLLREDYARRAGTAAACREAQGITDPDQAVSFAPHPGPELEALRYDTLRALEIADEHAEIRAMSRGELEAQVLDGDRVQATAPPDTSSQLRLTPQAEADAWQQAADAEADHDQERAENARSLAAALAPETSRLEAAAAQYGEWSARTESTRERAGNARVELQRRGQQPSARSAAEPQDMAAWWRDFQVHADAVDRAIDRERQAAIREVRPWPPGVSQKPGTKNRTPPRPGPDLSPGSSGEHYPRPRRSLSPGHPSRELRSPRLRDLAPLMTGVPHGSMSCRPRGRGRTLHRRATGRTQRQQ